MTRTIAVGAALLLAGASGCVASSKYEQKVKEAATNDTRAQEAAAKAAACEKELASVTAARNELQVKADALAEAKGKAEAKSAQYEQLAGSLQQQIKAGQVEISELRGRMIVKMKDKIMFPSGSASLNRDGRGALDAVAGVFKDMQGKNVIVAGYTDDLRVAGGKYQDNWELSAARAIAVVRYLTAKGVPPEMLGAAGFSQYRPVAPNDSKENRSQNRRIEIALTPAEPPPVVEGK